MVMLGVWEMYVKTVKKEVLFRLIHLPPLTEAGNFYPTILTLTMGFMK